MRDSSLPSATRPELTLESLVDLMNLCYTGLRGGKMSNGEEESCKMLRRGGVFFLGGGVRFFGCG